MPTSSNDELLKRALRKLKNWPKTLEDEVYARAFRMADKIYPGLEDNHLMKCRVFAMAYTQGFLNGRKSKRAK